MNANELKQYIIDNECVEQILDNLGCHDIKIYNTEYRAAMPNKKNNTAVTVKKDTLFTAIRTSDVSTKGDIFTLVMTIKGISFGEANRYLHNLLGIKYSFNSKEEKTDRIDPLEIFKKIKRCRHNANKDDVEIYDETCLKEYSDLPHISLIREGIMPFACKRFNVGYDYARKRIVFPERKWDGLDNEYIGISGRTTVPNYEMLGIPKYFKLSKEYPKGINLYGLNENYKTIQEAGYVVVFEAQKSVLKRYSLLDGTCVALGSCEVTEEQVRILVSLNVDIILALDEGITLSHIRKECEKFFNIRNVSYMYDNNRLIEKGSKNSPADMSMKIYKELFDNRINYNESEHNKFLRGE